MAFRGNVDLISSLPPEIIEKILTHLSPEQAVKTSVLSRTWRYRWTSMPDLNFEWAGLTAVNLVKGVNRCLHLHQGPIRKFGVDCSTLTVRNRIHPWMRFVLTPDLEELQVRVEGDLYPFPLDLFNCKKLTHLTLSGCKLYVPTKFEGFLNLKILHLSYMEVDCKIGMLISKSPLLESLTFRSCKSSNGMSTISVNLVQTKFEGFLNLKILQLSYMEVDCKIGMLISKSPLLESLTFHSCKSSDDMITISAPKLKYFNLRGEFKGICLVNATVLVHMIIDVYATKCNFIKLLGAAPNLERLTIHYFNENFKVGFYRGALSTTFNYLKIMKLSDVCLHEIEGIPLLLELLTSAPNLEKLVLKPRHNNTCRKVKSNCWQKEYPSGHGFMKLKVIEMLDISCVAHEFEFATFMLRNSPILEKMELRSLLRSGVIIKRMEKQLPKLSQASVQAEVTYHLSDSNCTLRYED